MVFDRGCKWQVPLPVSVILGNKCLLIIVFNSNFPALCLLKQKTRPSGSNFRKIEL